MFQILAFSVYRNRYRADRLCPLGNFLSRILIAPRLRPTLASPVLIRHKSCHCNFLWPSFAESDAQALVPVEALAVVESGVQLSSSRARFFPSRVAFLRRARCIVSTVYEFRFGGDGGILCAGSSESAGSNRGLRRTGRLTYYCGDFARPYHPAGYHAAKLAITANRSGACHHELTLPPHRFLVNDDKKAGTRV